MGASGNKKIGFDLYSDGHEWLILSLASTSSNETGISLGKAGPLESDADHRATMGRWTTLTAAVIGVKFDGAAMSALDTAFNNLTTQTSGPFPSTDAGDWWNGFTNTEKLAWADHYWATVKRLRF
jgi:hypothetical protein